LHEEEMAAVRAADVMLARDRDCRAWIRKYREPAPEGADEGREGRRERRRRRA
jgi:5-methyltetrahydrofolate--homocysteine methyltransferase